MTREFDSADLTKLLDALQAKVPKKNIVAHFKKSGLDVDSMADVHQRRFEFVMKTQRKPRVAKAALDEDAFQLLVSARDARADDSETLGQLRARGYHVGGIADVRKFYAEFSKRKA